MPCHPLKHWTGEVVGIICTLNESIKLMRGVWMEWHPFFGPTFFSDAECQHEIPEWWTRRRLKENFERWLEENPNA